MKKKEKEPKEIKYYMGLPYSILLHEIEDEGEKYWIAEVPELPGCKSHGASVEEAVSSIEEAKRDWILDCLHNDEQVPTPIERDQYSGKLLVRMSRSLHRSLSSLAENENLSLNQLIVTILAKEVGRLSVLNRTEDKVDDLLSKVNRIIEEDIIKKSVFRVAPRVLHRGIPIKLNTAEKTVIYEPLGGDEPISSAIASTDSPFEEVWPYQPEILTRNLMKSWVQSHESNDDIKVKVNET